MENVVKMPNTGTLPRDDDEHGTIRSAETGGSADSPRALPAVITVDPNDTYDEDKPREHIRSPELRRNGTKLMMTLSAVIGAAAGARLLFGGASETLSASVSRMLTGTFAEVFMRQLFLGALFLAAEFVLGFFALGDLAVWAAPFLYGAGTVLRLAASSPKLIPGALVSLVGVVLGAAFSADMSVMLLRLTRGGTVYTDTSPRRSYAVAFAGCLAAVALGSILTGALIG